MKNFTLFFSLFFTAGGLLFAQSPERVPTSEAIYSITFTSNWSQAAHPHSSGSLPSNAHWSKLVGATHNNQIQFFEPGQPASEGIENVAELGDNDAFFSEVNAAIEAGTASQIINGPALDSELGQMVIDQITVSADFPLVTVVSMIAPSPDWLIGENGVSLLDDDGDWRQKITLEMYPYDAGTDSGTDYNSENDNTDPQDLVLNAKGITPFSLEKIGRLVIQLESVLATPDFKPQNTLSVYPNPTDGQLSIAHTSGGIRSVEVFNVLGARVMAINGINRNSWDGDISSFKKGVYMLKIIDAGGLQTVKKIVKR